MKLTTHRRVQSRIVSVLNIQDRNGTQLHDQTTTPDHFSPYSTGSGCSRCRQGSIQVDSVLRRNYCGISIDSFVCLRGKMRKQTHLAHREPRQSPAKRRQANVTRISKIDLGVRRPPSNHRPCRRASTHYRKISRKHH